MQSLPANAQREVGAMDETTTRGEAMGYGTNDLICIANRICIGCRRAFVTDRRRCDKCRVKLNKRQVARSALTRQIKQRLLPHTESRIEMYTWTTEQEAQMRSSAEMIKVLNSLNPADREKTEAVVRRHVEACRRNGVKVKSMDRVWIEALELVRMGGDDDGPPPRQEPLRSYTQYVSPKEGML